MAAKFLFLGAWRLGVSLSGVSFVGHWSSPSAERENPLRGFKGFVHLTSHNQEEAPRRRGWETIVRTPPAELPATPPPPPARKPLSLDANAVIWMSKEEVGTISKAKQLMESRELVISDRVAQEVISRREREWMNQYVRVFQRFEGSTDLVGRFQEFLVEKTNATPKMAFGGNEFNDLAAYLDACSMGYDHLTFDQDFIRRLSFTNVPKRFIEDHVRNPTTLYVAVPRESSSQLTPRYNDGVLMAYFKWIVVLRG